MAQFVDGSGKTHTLKIRNLGHLETIQEHHGVELDKVFMQDDGVQIALLLWGDLRRLAGILADLCGLTAEEAKEFIRGMDDEAIERGRQALMESLADFCLPPTKRGAFKEKIPAMLDMNSLDGSAKDTESAAQ